MWGIFAKRPALLDTLGESTKFHRCKVCTLLNVQIALQQLSV